MAEYDNLCKILAQKYPRDFTRWLSNQESQKIEILKTELSIEPIRADSVTFLKTENRMRAYRISNHNQIPKTNSSEDARLLRSIDT